MPTVASIRPADPQASGFREFARYVEGNTRPWVRIFRAWSGGADDAAPPSTGQFPFVRLTPIAHAAEPIAGRGDTQRRLYRSPMRVNIELAVAGNLVDDLMNLWGRLENVIFPDPDGAAGRSALLDNLAPYGVRDIRLLQRALPDSADALTAETIGGMGAVLLVFEFAV